MIKVLLSGGMDSAVCLAWATFKHGPGVDCLFFSYGQRHCDQEYLSALKVAAQFGSRVWSVNLNLGSNSSLTGGRGELVGEDVVVPNRNEAMLRRGASLFPGRHPGYLAPDVLVMGCCRDDWDVFEDCRPEFFDRMRAELDPVKIETPLIDLDKKQVYEMAKTYGGTALIDMTWSCYAGGDEPCGVCGACVARSRGIGG